MTGMMIRHINGVLDPAEYEHRLVVVRNSVVILRLDDRRRGDAAIGHPRTLVPPGVIPEGSKIVCLVRNDSERSIDAYFYHPSFQQRPQGCYPIDCQLTDINIFGRELY